MTATPLYPFGYGLSYTTFHYSDIAVTPTSDSNYDVSFKLTNTGQRRGDEVVQLYIRDLVGSISRPVKELKDFARITLKPGETKTVDFTITADKLKFYNSELIYDCEPGEFDLMIGPNSRDVETRRFTVQ